MSYVKVDVLLRGKHTDYVNPSDDMSLVIEPLTSSSTLIVGKSVTVVDTGTPPYRKAILASLRREKVKPGEVEYLIISHGHQDHWLNVGLYPNAAIITEPNVKLVHGNRCEVFRSGIVHDDWEIVPTNGHMASHMSVCTIGMWNGLAKRIVIAGDAFREDLWRSGYYGSLQAKPGERESANWIMQNAEVIIPGHFRVLEKQDIGELLELEVKS